MESMRAAVIAAPGQTELRDVPRPEPRQGEVRVRIEGCGMCGSDLAPWAGLPWLDYPREPGAPGHEAWGRVDALGPDVSGLDVGQRVTGLFQNAYAEQAVLPAAHVVPLPDWLHGRAFPGEPLACAMNAFRRSDIRRGQKVAIIGTGFLGALLTGLCAEAGASVLAVSRRATSLKTAERMGARHLLASEDPDEVVREVERLTDGALCDRVIEVTGKQAPLDLAGRLARTRGTLVVAGYHQDGPRTIDMQLWNWKGLDVVNAHERDPGVYLRGIHEALEAVEQQRLDPWALFTHEVPLAHIQRGFALLRDRPDGFLKTLVRP